MAFDPVSHLNGRPEVMGDRRPPAGVIVSDVTLREAEQSDGIAFGLQDKRDLARLLEDCGVQQIQVGYPGRFQRDTEAATFLAGELGVAVEVVALGFTAEWERDVDACLETGAAVVNVVFRASDRLHRVLGIDRAHALERTAAVIGRAAAGDALVAFSPSDATRADIGFLEELLAVAVAAGARRVSINDSVGAATPELIGHLVERARAVTGVPVAIHCHSDFGLGVANTVSGVLAGAEVVDVAVNGLGDRAGNAALEEVVAALELLYGIDTGIRLERLTELSSAFAEASGRPLAPNKPITGTCAFVHSLPTHVSAMAKDPCALQPFEPERVGNVQRVVQRAAGVS